MTQYPTCRHIKEDGAYCGSPALRDRKYCYYHLMERARRLRRARALRDNVPYQLEVPSLDNLYAIRNAITEIVQAIGSGQLDPRAAGKMLYGIQQVSSVNRRIEKMEAAQAEETKAAPDQAGDHSRIQEYPGFEKEFDLDPGADLDAETAFVLRKAEAEAERLQPEPMPTPPPGMRPGSPAYRVYREEAYQILQLQVKRMQGELREFYELKRQQFEMTRKEVASAKSLPLDRADTA